MKIKRTHLASGLMALTAILGLGVGAAGTTAYAACDKREIEDLSHELADAARDLADVADDYGYRSMRDLKRDAQDLEDAAWELADAAEDRQSCSRLERKYKEVRSTYRATFQEVVESLVDSHRDLDDEDFDSDGSVIIVGGSRTITIGDGRPRVTRPVGGLGGRGSYDFHANREMARALGTIIAILDDLNRAF